jgi:hypothetical protein
MKSKILILIFIALFLNACSPSPSNEIYSLELDVNEFKKSEHYERFWDIMDVFKKNQERLSDEDFIKENRANLVSLFESIGIDSVECSNKLRDIGLDAKNKKVMNHFLLRCNMYEKVGQFWALDWSDYLAGKSKLPNFVQLIDDTYNQKSFYDNEYLKLRSET